MQDTQFNDIVEELKKEAEILKPNGWQKFWATISGPVRYPLRFLSWPFRALFSIVIVPAAYEESLNDLAQAEEYCPHDTEALKLSNNNFFHQEIKYGIPRNDSCSMIFTVNKNDTKAVEKRKLTIFFSGNGQTALSSLDGLVRLHSMGNNNITNDVLFVDWPKGAKSSKELVNSGLQAVFRAISAGYKPENITISGFSLGGAVAAEVLKESKKYLEPNEKFHAYVNHRSFSDLESVVAGWISNVKVINFILKTIINGLLSLLGLNLDAGSAIKSGLPVGRMKFYYTL
jgi:hypothetical protein